MKQARSAWQGLPGRQFCLVIAAAVCVSVPVWTRAQIAVLAQAGSAGSSGLKNPESGATSPSGSGAVGPGGGQGQERDAAHAGKSQSPGAEAGMGQARKQGEPDHGAGNTGKATDRSADTPARSAPAAPR